MQELTFLVLFSILQRLTDTCVSTSGAGTTTTTTVMPASCTNCTASQITFTPTNPQKPGSIDATFTNPGPDASGCAQLTALCVGRTGTVAFMQFNMNQGGPAQNADMMSTVMAPLVCVDGLWVYLGPPETRNITEVNCSEVFPIG